MAVSLRTFQFSVNVHSPDEWNDKARDKATSELNTYLQGYEDWAVEGLVQAMREAGNKYLKEHQTEFKGALL